MEREILVFELKRTLYCRGAVGGPHVLVPFYSFFI
jgi:hypothetical protein